MVKIKVFTWPSSERKLKVKVASLSKKLDEKPVREINLDEDGYDEIKDDLHTMLKNDEVENPYTDDRSI